jgi:cellulose synthase/poly-beta-1,6-N-acetylglucosamine synthase-like glycosyltransferase
MTESKIQGRGASGRGAMSAGCPVRRPVRRMLGSAHRMISFVIISKDEAALGATLDALDAERSRLGEPSEIIVVDASQQRPAEAGAAREGVRWIDFRPPDGVRVSIPHQRNRGVREARGEIIVFTDVGCLPEPGWAKALVAPIAAGAESVTSGRTTGQGGVDIYDALGSTGQYVVEAPTINLAFRRGVYEQVGGFDESFAYGSDVDFTWRLADAGHRILYVPEAVIRADWGSVRRQLRRSWAYGRARARLYAKHPQRLREAWRREPVPLAYALFLLGLPVARRYPGYLLLIGIPFLRNRRTGPFLTLADHLLQGAGLLREALLP